MSDELAVNRTCGNCNVCCVALTIDEPQLRKPQGVRCRNARPDNGCGIYAERPSTCQTFYCGWRRWPWTPESFRPSQCGVLLREYPPKAKHADLRKSGVAIMLLPNVPVDADGLYATIVSGVSRGVPMVLEIPGHPGYTAATISINARVAAAVAARDKPAVLAFVREAFDQAAKVTRSLVVLAPEEPIWSAQKTSEAPSLSADA